VLRLVKSELGAAGKRDRRRESEIGFGDGATEFHASGFEIGDRGFDVVAHQVELAVAALFGGVDSQFRGRKRVDEPAVASVNGRQF